MPSFFFHIAFDLDAASAGNQPPLAFPHDDQHKNKSIVTNSADFTTESSNKALSPPSSSGSEASIAVASSRLTHDWRYDKISVQNYSMAQAAAMNKVGEEATGHITNGISAGSGGLATKGRYEPLDPKQEEVGWGVIRLYRDAEETPGLYDEPVKSPKGSKHALKKGKDDEIPFRDEDCTTLCILAVPSYLTPSDFLGFVGEKTRDDVSHFRMIRTERGNRYMVLMRFRSGKKAREWRREWNGKAFDGMEPENCHVVFVKSIEFRIHQLPGQEASFPDMTNDPFTPSVNKSQPVSSTPSIPQAAPISSSSRSSKPHAPPTPALIELPTCPVCLERMDESTGLLTILCQHVFHCSCLQKWRGSGCPVCRYTQDDMGPGKRTSSYTSNGEEAALNECSVCHSDANLWICLICGNVGCGRYDEAHAYSHFTQSRHSFAMDMTTQRVWDYERDSYVHRIIQNKADGKFVELTPTSTTQPPTTHDDHDDFDDYVPRMKLDNIGLEYSHLLTSQLDSQRMYFEEILERAADKASQAALSAEAATAAATKTAAQLTTLQLAHDLLTHSTIPTLEKDRDRAVRKAEKFETMARKLEKEWREEKAMNESFMQRVGYMEKQVESLRREKGELEEQNRDLGFFISGGERLRGLGGVEGEEVREGRVSLPEVGGEGEGSGKGGSGKGGSGKKKGGKGKK